MGFVAHVNRGEGWNPVYLSRPTGETAKVSAHEPGDPDGDRQEHQVRVWVERDGAEEFATEADARQAWDEYLAIQGVTDLAPWALDVEPT